MILTARLFIKGHKTEQDGIPLNFCEFSYSQGIDKRGMPDSNVTGGIIKLSYPSIDDPEILAWMTFPHQTKAGKIEFSGDDTTKPFKELFFSDAVCIGYIETYSRDNEMIIQLTITAREITVSLVNLANDWSGY